MGSVEFEEELYPPSGEESDQDALDNSLQERKEEILICKLKQILLLKYSHVRVILWCNFCEERSKEELRKAWVDKSSDCKLKKPEVFTKD